MMRGAVGNENPRVGLGANGAGPLISEDAMGGGNVEGTLQSDDTRSGGGVSWNWNDAAYYYIFLELRDSIKV